MHIADTVLPESKKLEGKEKISNSIWEAFENGRFSRLQEMPVSGWDHFNDPLSPENAAVSRWRISLSSAEDDDTLSHPTCSSMSSF